MKRYIKKGIAAVLIIGAGVLLWLWVGKEKNPELQYITAKAARGDLKSTVLASGKVRAVSTVNVGTQISGTIKDIYIDYNSTVKKGDLIALIDPATELTDVAQAEASYRASLADLAQAQANLEYKNQNLKRTRELSRLDLIARSNLDTDINAVVTAQAQVAASRSRLQQQKAALNRAQILLGYTRIYSPVNGVIVSKNVDVGQTVAASFNTPTIVQIAENLEKMQVEVDVDEADIGSIAKGMKVEFTVDSFPDKIYTGCVEQIRIAPQENNNVVSYTVIVPFLNHGQRLMPGMTANVTFIVQEKKNVIKLPNAAFRFRPVEPESKNGAGMGGGIAKNGENDEEDKDSVSLYTMENGKPVKLKARRGSTDGVQSEIISGVQEGQEIITGIEAPKDN